MKLRTVADIAYRNIRRNKRRSFLSMAAISVAAMVIVFMFSLIEGFKQDLTGNLFRFVTGMLRVRHTAYDEYERLNPLHLRIENYRQVLDTLTALPGEEWPELSLLASPRIRFLGTMYKKTEGQRIIRLQEDMQRAIGLGVDFEREEAYQQLTEKLQPGGRLPRPGQDEILLAQGLAQTMDVTVGDTVTFLTYGMQREMQLKSFTVTGLLVYTLQGMNQAFSLIPLDTAQEFLQMDESVTEILILLDDNRQGDIGQQPERLAGLASRAEEQLHVRPNTELSVRSWTQIGNWYALIRLASIAYDFIALFFFILGTTVIINTTMMVIYERMREIGTIAAMGMTGREIILLFFLEAFFISLIAALAGVLLGIGITVPVSIIGLDFTQAMEGVDIEVSPIFYPVLNLRSTVFVFFYAVLVASLASYFPSRRAARIEPVEALRGV